MTAVLNSQVTARLELKKIIDDSSFNYYELIIKKGKETTIVVITEGEAKVLADHLGLLIQNA